MTKHQGERKLTAVDCRKRGQAPFSAEHQKTRQRGSLCFLFVQSNIRRKMMMHHKHKKKNCLLSFYMLNNYVKIENLYMHSL